MPSDPRDHGRRMALPFDPPDSALAEVLNEVGPKGGETRAARAASRRVDDPIAARRAQGLGQSLARRRVSDGWIGIEIVRRRIPLAGISKRPDEVGEQFGVVAGVLVAADVLELAREMIRNLAQTGRRVEPAVPRGNSGSE